MNWKIGKPMLYSTRATTICAQVGSRQRELQFAVSHSPLFLRNVFSMSDQNQF